MSFCYFIIGGKGYKKDEAVGGTRRRRCVDWVRVFLCIIRRLFRDFFNLSGRFLYFFLLSKLELRFFLLFKLELYV